MSRNQREGQYVGCFKNQQVRLGKYSKNWQWQKVVKSKQSRYVLEEREHERNAYNFEKN